jgi:hypothetical protein
MEFPDRPYDYSADESSYFDALSDPSNVDKLDVFLRRWKMSRVLARRSRTWKRELDELLGSNSDLLTSLRQINLLSSDPRGFRQSVVSLFDSLEGILGPTAAAKIFHIQVPNLCPLWDAKIRRSYGCSGNGEGYYNFMRRMKEELEEVVGTYKDAYPSSSNPVGDLMARIASPFPKISVMRVLDHYNYLKYTRHSMPATC